jgi:hypothetical protein
MLQIGGTTGGMKVGVSVPSGVNVAFGIVGVTTGVSNASVILTTPTCTAQPFNGGAGSGFIYVNGTILAPVGCTGIIQFLIAPVAATGITGYISTGSYFSTEIIN